MIRLGIRISDPQCLKETGGTDPFCVFCAMCFGSNDGRAHRITLRLRKYSVYCV